MCACGSKILMAASLRILAQAVKRKYAVHWVRMQNRSSSWARKLVLLLCLLLLLTALGIGYWVRALRDRNWSALLARVEELSSVRPPPAPARLSMGRTLVPGNAWDDYLNANIWSPGKPPEVIAGKIGPYLHRQPKANRSEMESL